MRFFPATVAVVIVAALPQTSIVAEVIHLEAKDTLTALEMDCGDELHFTLASGRTVQFVLEETEAAILERVNPGGIVYRFACHVRIDGQAIELERFVCAQECFYEPYVISGLRIWPDIVKDVFDLVPVRYPRKGNLRCVPRKAARFALQDATLRICPDETRPWLAEDDNFIDVGRCYNGDDCYLGPYLGQACHVGMDINHRRGSPLFAPIDFDTHAYFNSLKMGHNNNRWRGIRKWSNGDVWAMQTHHLIELTTPPNQRLPAGIQYAATAGVHVGSHDHTHFEFKIGCKNSLAPLQGSEDPASIDCPINFDDESEAAQQQPEVLHLDPWIVFWQIFEDRKERWGAIRARMAPLPPTETGTTTSFSATESHPGPGRSQLAYYWSFGDGGVARSPEATHVFASPGVYPVTLWVDDGERRDTCTQHVVVAGDAVAQPIMALCASPEPAFRPRRAGATSGYGREESTIANTLSFLACESCPTPTAKTVRIRNLVGGAPLQAGKVYVRGAKPAWLNVTPQDTPAGTVIKVAVDAAGQKPGRHMVEVMVECEEAANSPQLFLVEMQVQRDQPPETVIVDDQDAGFYATPSFWVGHRFCRCPPSRRGYAGFYLTNGGRAAPSEFVRFTPDLRAGNYTVSLSAETPFRPDCEFHVHVRHGDGESMVRMRPNDSRTIGTFRFDEGADGYVEIHAEASKGLVIADAIVFEKIR
jgi:hypothetical protein